MIFRCRLTCAASQAKRAVTKRSSIGSDHALPRKRPVQDQLPRRPADLPDPAGPDRDRAAAGASRSVVVPLLASEYLFRAILIPFLILSLAALGLNILVGYCGQISLGTGAFMAVGAYAAYNFSSASRACRCSLALLLGGAVRDRGRRAVRHSVPAHQGPVPGGRDAGGAVLRRLGVPAHQLVHQQLVVGLGQRRPACRSSAWPIETPAQKYLFCLAFLVVFAHRSRRTWCAATSAASGWRSATWTSPPR